MINIKSGKSTVEEWFLDDTIYTVHDDFSTYPNGALTSNSKWTIVTTGGGSCTISDGTYGRQMLLNTGIYAYSGANYLDVDMIGLINLNYWCNLVCVFNAGVQKFGSTTAAIYVRINGGSYVTLGTASGGSYGGSCSFTLKTWLLIYRNNSNLYDVYIGGYKVATNQTSVTSVGFRVYSSVSGSYQGSASCNMIINEVGFF